jgi:hypothetical protein
MTESQTKIVKMAERGILEPAEAISLLIAGGMDVIEATGHVAGELDTTGE